MTRQINQIEPTSQAGPVSTPKKVTLTFAEISQRLHAAPLPEVDAVVGIARGGLVPAALVAHQLQVPLVMMRVNYRDDDNNPRTQTPKLLHPHDANLTGQRVLLVDDVSVSGSTLRFAASLLYDTSQITTLTMKGRADIVLFPEVASCVHWPWSLP